MDDETIEEIERAGQTCEEAKSSESIDNEKIEETERAGQISNQSSESIDKEINFP